MADIEEKLLKSVESLEKLVALIAVKDKKPNEKIQLLSSIGIQPKDIAKILDKTPNSVSAVLSRKRKKGKTSKAK